MTYSKGLLPQLSFPENPPPGGDHGFRVSISWPSSSIGERGSCSVVAAKEEVVSGTGTGFGFGCGMAEVRVKRVVRTVLRSWNFILMLRLV